MIDWKALNRLTDLNVDSPFVDVLLSDGRKHRVEAVVTDDGVLLQAFAAKQSTVRSLPDLPLDLWMRNRTTALVSFRIDHRSRLVAECQVPVHGLTTEELAFCLRQVSIEADRLEFLLTGRDVH